MVLSVVGALLMALGLFAGSVLVVVPLGLVPWSPDVVLWVLFPLFSLLGYALFVIGAKAGNIRALSVVVSSLLLLLAVASALALLLEAASVVYPVGDTFSLWYVLVVAGVLGAIGAASYSKANAPA